jgi:uncharacterized membrane protein
MLNVSAWINHWDPYPFILLNLALSFQADYTAPILVITQNRQAHVSERRNHLDLLINTLAELETTEILRPAAALPALQDPPRTDLSRRAFEEETKPAEIVRQIRGELEAQSVIGTPTAE